ncbi:MULTISPECIES: hypothetical protein [Priestia]|uniref:hypothetical protein n=1 Tax=Priestia TaxID=2800373 RepID=UPI0023311DC4|nr:hypothetical protein [Priestia sp. AB]MDC0705032.1 hypothetical protein [Priestia sp. AB]MED4212375.1 hypothetical protein [Priestia megaterium]
MKKKNNVIPFPQRREATAYVPASISLDKDIVEFLEIMNFEDRNDFLNEMIDSFFKYVKGEEDEVR